MEEEEKYQEKQARLRAEEEAEKRREENKSEKAEENIDMTPTKDLTPNEIESINQLIKQWISAQDPNVVVKLLGFCKRYANCEENESIPTMIFNINDKLTSEEFEKERMEFSKHRYQNFRLNMNPESVVEAIDSYYDARSKYYGVKGDAYGLASIYFSFILKILRRAGWSKQKETNLDFPTTDYDSLFKEEGEIIKPPEETEQEEKKEEKEEDESDKVNS